MIVFSSMGGCASTMVLNWFAKRLDCNCPRNSEGLPQPGKGGNFLGLKHRGGPPEQFDIPIHESIVERSKRPRPRIERAVFLFDDPRPVVLSLFARGIAVGHAMAVTGQRPDHGNELKVFLDLGIDSFGLSSQFCQWSNEEIACSYPRMLVRGTELWNRLPEILSFVGLDEKMKTEFPLRKQRPRRYEQLDPVLKRKLDAIYSDVAGEMRDFPDVFVIEGKAS